jgi:PAS domain S-box-containing protein
MKQELHESKEHYRSLVKTNPDSVVKMDVNGIIQYVSPQTVHMHGYYNEEELIRRSVFELFAPSEKDIINENILKTLEDEYTSNIEYYLQKKDGSLFIG